MLFSLSFFLSFSLSLSLTHSLTLSLSLSHSLTHSLTHSLQVTDFLWPRWGLENGERLLELLHSDRFVSRPLLVHAFSIGCYTFSQMLVHVSQNPEKCQAFTSRIISHVYDSAVVGSLEKMAKGNLIAKQMTLELSFAP